MEFSPKLGAALVFALASAMVVTAWNEPQDIVDAHNAVRADVGVGPVSWDNTVAAFAQAYTEQHRVDRQLVPFPAPRPYGENQFRTDQTGWNVVDALGYWAARKRYYDHATNTCSAPDHDCSKYLQLVWRDSTHIGCGAAHCEDGSFRVLLICFYNPPPVEGQIPY